MTGKLLIIDSNAGNRILLDAALASAFYEVAHAETLSEAQFLSHKVPPDLIISTETLKDGKALNFCKRLKKAGRNASNIPFLVVTSSKDRAFRIDALRAGADDVLTYPIDEPLLLARLRSLLRNADSEDDRQIKNQSVQAVGFAEQKQSFSSRSSIHISTEDSATGGAWKRKLEQSAPYLFTSSPHAEALQRFSSHNPPDVFVICPDPANPDGALCLIAEIRARKVTRNAGILVVLPEELSKLKGNILDLGAHDVQTGGLQEEELLLRISRLVQQKKLKDRAKARVQDGLKAAITDPLTGLFNRRYALPQLKDMKTRMVAQQETLGVMIVDLDHFKKVNDTNGHATGDAALVETARRIRATMRPVDMVARLGGDEFLIAMPGISKQEAEAYAKALCETVRETPIAGAAPRKNVSLTLSIGVTLLDACNFQKTAETVIEEADKALYAAKANGRDQVAFCPIYA